jgi:hypothetical protein
MGEPEVAAEQAILAFIGCLRDFAGELGSGDQERLEAKAQALDEACAKTVDQIGPANLKPILARENPAATFLLGLIVERANLGHGMIVGNGDDRREETPKEEILEEISDVLSDLESLGLSDKIEAYLDEDQDAAAMALGAYVARGGNSDLFSGAPWSEGNLRACLAAAAITTAVLTRLSHLHGAPDSEFAGLTPDAIANSDHAALAAYWAAELEGDSDLSGFGAPSMVVEDILLEADFLDELEVPDLHRLSGSLLDAFLAGASPDEETEAADDYEDEPEQAQELLREARALGFEARDDQDDFSPDAPTGPFGHLPGHDKVQ